MHVYLTVLAHTRCGQCQSLHVLGFHDSLARWKPENTTEAPVSKPSMLVLPRIPSLPPGAMLESTSSQDCTLSCWAIFSGPGYCSEKEFLLSLFGLQLPQLILEQSNKQASLDWKSLYNLTDLKISAILMSQHLECQDYRCEPPCPSKLFCLFREDSL